jgi:hypothetical protein
MTGIIRGPRVKARRQGTDPLLVDWSSARSFAAGLDSRAAGRLAIRVYPHRSAVLAAGLSTFLLGAFPLILVAHAGIRLAAWHALTFGLAVLGVLWAFALATFATHFHPRHGLIGPTHAGRTDGPPHFLCACAAFTVWGFAAAPLAVLVASLA